MSFAGKEGGTISAQGIVSNGLISFDRVNFIKQLENNLLSVSQICDKGFKVLFDDKCCYILMKEFEIPEDRVIMSAGPNKSICSNSRGVSIECNFFNL